jgi:hypothetical protein
MTRLIDTLRVQAGVRFSAEAIMWIARPLSILSPQGDRRPSSPAIVEELSLAERLRALPSHYAIGDGRKWSAVPFVVIYQETDTLSIEMASRAPANVYCVGYLAAPGEAAKGIARVILEYRRRLLDDLDNLGFLVTYSEGRYRLGPALQPKEGLEGQLYFGQVDRLSRTDRWYTIDRELLGVQYESELFETLLNDPDVTEPKPQRFFEEHVSPQ